jgi:SP family sugar:H+ symporter-like MFS transporter
MSLTTSSILIFSIMISFYVVERAGRRALIVYGGCIACVLNVVIGTMGVIAVNDAVLNASLAIICIWVFNYACCFAGTGWTAIGEIATPRLRAKTAAFAASTNAIAGAIYNSCVSMLTDRCLS